MDDMIGSNMLGSVFCFLILAVILLGIRSGRKNVEKRDQEIYKHQDDVRQTLKQMLDSQIETNKLLRELITKTEKR